MEETTLSQLAAVQGVELAPDLALIETCLAGPLARYRELELRPEGGRIDLVTLTEAHAGVAGLLELLEARQASASARSRLAALARFGAGHTLGMKIPLSAGTAGGELYVRGALPVAELRHFLQRQGVNDAALEAVAAFGACFGKAYAHMLACDAAEPASFQVYFTTYLAVGAEQADRAQLAEALGGLGIEPAGVEATLGLHALLGASRPETLYASLSLVDGAAIPRAKIDYAGVRLGLVAEAIAELGGGDAAADGALKWGQVLRVPRADYLGVIVQAAGPAAVRAYFTRYSAVRR